MAAPSRTTVLDEGPRCAWPRSGPTSSSPRAEDGKAGLAMTAEVGKVWKYDGPDMAPASDVAEGPRCAWPRSGPTSSWPRAAGEGLAPAPVPEAGAGKVGKVWKYDGPDVAPASDVAEGPRCAWPRSGPTSSWPRTEDAVGEAARAMAAEVGKVWKYEPAPASPGHQWPRVGRPVAMETSTGGDNPRCAWPREGISNGVPQARSDDVSGAGLLNFAVGAVWGVKDQPEAGAEEEDVAALIGEARTMAMGARSAWPRRRRVAAASRAC